MRFARLCLMLLTACLHPVLLYCSSRFHLCPEAPIGQPGDAARTLKCVEVGESARRVDAYQDSRTSVRLQAKCTSHCVNCADCAPALPTHWEAANAGDAAAARCAEDAGIPVKIAVVESGGNLAAFLRMPGAFLHWSIPRSTRSTPQRASSELKRGHLYFGERGHCDFGLTNV